MRPDLRSLLVAASVGALLTTAANAGDRTYRWLDEKGRVHYSDVKNAKGEQVEIKRGGGVANAPKDSAAAVAARQLECQRKKDQLQVYSGSAQISETDALGNTRTYTAAERQKFIERSTAEVNLACGPSNATTASTDAPRF